MAYDITRVKADLEGALHGTTVNQVQNLYGVFDRAARDVLADIDPAETVRITPFVTAIFNNVTDYAAPVDLKGDRVIDVFPLAPANDQGVVNQGYEQALRLLKDQLSVTGANLFSTRWNNGVKSLQVALSLPSTSLLSNCDSLTSNGAWAAGGDANDLTLDTVNYVEGSGSLRFNLGAGNLELEDGDGNLRLEDIDGSLALEDGSLGTALTGYLENSTLEAVDLSDQERLGSLLCYVYVPAGASIDSFNLRWGSSATDYWDHSVTTNQEGTTFQTGWNLLRFDWIYAQATGSPDSAAITYVRFTTHATATDLFPMRLDNLVASNGQCYQLEYYSKYLFRDATTGAFQETVTSDTNLLNLDTDSYQVFFNRVMVLCAQQLQGIDATYFDGAFFQNAYDQSVTRYKAKYKSQLQKPKSDYYPPTTPGYTKYYGANRFTP